MPNNLLACAYGILAVHAPTALRMSTQTSLSRPRGGKRKGLLRTFCPLSPTLMTQTTHSTTEACSDVH